MNLCVLSGNCRGQSHISIRPLGGQLLLFLFLQLLAVVVDGRDRLLEAGHRVLLPDRRDLSGPAALRSLLREEDPEGREQQLEIREDVHVVYVQQVELELLVRVGVVLPVDLRVTGPSRFDLQPQAEVRQELIILLGNFRPLRAGANNRHITHQDIKQLRQFIQTVLAHDTADRRDAVVLVARGEPRHPVLLRVYPHRAELVDLESLAVLGQTHLLVERRAPVVKMDRRRGDEQDRAEDQQRERGGDEIEGALHERVLGIERGARDEEHRRVKGLDVPRLLHDDVPDVRQEKAEDPVLLAVFDNAVAAARVDPRDEDRLETLQPVLDGLEAVAVVPELLRDRVQALARFPADRAEALLVQLVAVDQQRFLGRVEPAVIAADKVRPHDVQEQLHGEPGDQEPGPAKLPPGDAHDGPQDPRAEKLGQELREDQRADPAIAEQIGVVGAVEEQHEDAVARQDIVIVAVAVHVHAAQFAIAEQEPADIKDEKRETEMYKLEQHDVVALLIITIHDSNPQCRVSDRDLSPGYAGETVKSKADSRWDIPKNSNTIL